MTDKTNGTEPDFSGERTITEFWASVGGTNSSNTMASEIPFGLGILVYFPAYVARIWPFAAIRYTLTNRRLRVDTGMLKKTTQSVALEEIDDVRLVNDTKFTRTGDLEIVCNGEVALRMAGIQDPSPARQTILDAINAYVQVQRVVDRQRMAKAEAESAETENAEAVAAGD